MAKAVEPATWENGFKAPSTGTPWVWPPSGQTVADEDPDAYVSIPSKDLVTSTAHNDLGVSLQRTWPTLYDGTNSPHGTPDWWVPKKEVDVLIVGGMLIKAAGGGLLGSSP
jgi:phenol 2-monooxygenase (NADPH)